MSNVRNKTNTYWQHSGIKAIVASFRLLLAIALLCLASFLFATPASPKMNLSGVTTVGTTKKICVGQKISASVVLNAVPIDINNPGSFHFSWTISAGRPKDNYVASQTGAQVYNYTAPDSSSTQWYFTMPSSSVTVSCTVTPPSPGTPYTLSANVQVAGPDRSDDFSVIGNMQYVSGYNPADAPCTWATWDKATGLHPTGFILWGVPNNVNGQTPPIWGSYQKDTVQNPSFLTAAGEWGYVQKYELNDTLNGSPLVGSGLDKSFPYTLPWNTTSVNTGPNFFYDSPGAGCPAPTPPQTPLTFASVTRPFVQIINRTFHIYIFYKPPSTSVGSSIYVPIVCANWTAKGCWSTVDLLLSSYIGYDQGSGWVGEESYPEFPTW